MHLFFAKMIDFEKIAELFHEIDRLLAKLRIVSCAAGRKGASCLGERKQAGSPLVWLFR